MTVKFNEWYMVCTKRHPRKFLADNGECTDDIRYAAQFASLEEANQKIQCLDSPESFEPYVAEVNLTYNKTVIL